MAASLRARAEPPPAKPKEEKEKEKVKEREMIISTGEDQKANEQRMAAVVYYLTRNGHLEHPHFMEVSLSSPGGLYLRDVISRLGVLRGRLMTKMYSWSSKRSYKNGFVWHDLSEEDFIHPLHGREYVLKGTELVHIDGAGQSTAASAIAAAVSYSASSEKPLAIREINEYKVHKKATDASTQTATDQRPHDSRRRNLGDGGREEAIASPSPPQARPPQSSSCSSVETLEELIQADAQRRRRARRRLVARQRDLKDYHQSIGAAGGGSAGTAKASAAMLMHLFSCGSIAVKDNGLCLVSQYKARVAFAARRGELEKEMETIPSFRKAAAMAGVEKEYFSGSLVETRKTMGSQDDQKGGGGELRRSSSFNGERNLRIDMMREDEEAHASTRMPGRSKISRIQRRDDHHDYQD